MGKARFVCVAAVMGLQGDGARAIVMDGSFEEARALSHSARACLAPAHGWVALGVLA